MIFNPIFEMEALQRILDNFFDEGFRTRYFQEDYNDVNLFESKDGYILEFLVPGVKLENISIDVNNGILSVSVKREIEEKKNENYKLLKSERMNYDFVRNIKLSNDVDPEKIDAKLTNGILMIYLPKKPEAKPKKISVKVQ